MIPRSVFIRSGAGVVAVALLSLAAAVLLPPEPAHATTFQLIATVERAQAQSTCPGASAATGSGLMTYDDVSNLLTWSITFSGLSGPASAAHFHGPAAKGVDAGIQVYISPLTSPGAGSATITQAQEADLLAGLYYINYHTAMCPGGEIRGQVRQAKVGGIASAPELDRPPLEAEDTAGGNAGFVAAGAVAAAAVAAGGVALFAWRRRVR